MAAASIGPIVATGEPNAVEQIVGSQIGGIHMLKVMFIATALFSFSYSCAKPIQPTPAKPDVTHPSNTERSEASLSACDFSKYNPLKLGLSTGGYATSLPRPAYPTDAKDQHAASQVTLKLLINVQTGSVEQACFVSGNNLFEESSKEAALRSKFSFAKPKPFPKGYAYAEGVIVYNFAAQ